jgi:sugar phosphate isomerase/epimerase
METSDACPWKLGICDFSNSEPLRNFELIQDAGFDYIEPGLAKATMLSPRELAVAAQNIVARKYRVLSMNWFLPPGVKVTGPDVDPKLCRQYVEKAFAVADSLGAVAVVFGSPGSRSIEEGFSMQTAWEQLVVFCHLCADVIRENGYDIRLGIEHVNYTETNVIRKLEEAIRLAKEVDRPEIGVAVDFYHLVMENEPMETILGAKGMVVAVQMANPATRAYPKKDDEIPQLKEFFQMLNSIGYLGGIGIEANVGDVAVEGAEALAYLQRIIAEALS